MDWPTVDVAAATEWPAAQADLEASLAALSAALLRADEAWFRPGESGFVMRWSRNALGSLTHLTWHAGQIAMLRRAQGLEPHAEE